MEVNDDDYDVENLFKKNTRQRILKRLLFPKKTKKKKGDIFGTRRDQLVQLHHHSVCKARPGYLESYTRHATRTFHQHV